MNELIGAVKALEQRFLKAKTDFCPPFSLISAIFPTFFFLSLFSPSDVSSCFDSNGPYYAYLLSTDLFELCLHKKKIKGFLN